MLPIAICDTEKKEVFIERGAVQYKPTYWWIKLMFLIDNS